MLIFEFKCVNCGTIFKLAAPPSQREAECDCGAKAVRTDQLVFKMQRKGVL